MDPILPVAMEFVGMAHCICSILPTHLKGRESDRLSKEMKTKNCRLMLGGWTLFSTALSCLHRYARACCGTCSCGTCSRAPAPAPGATSIPHLTKSQTVFAPVSSINSLVLNTAGRPPVRCTRLPLHQPSTIRLVLSCLVPTKRLALLASSNCNLSSWLCAWVGARGLVLSLLLHLSTHTK